MDINMQDDFSSVHRMARQKGYDPNTGILVDTCCNMRYYMTYTHKQLVLSGIESSAIALSMATTSLASQLFIMQC